MVCCLLVCACVLMKLHAGFESSLHSLSVGQISHPRCGHTFHVSATEQRISLHSAVAGTGALAFGEVALHATYLHTRGQRASMMCNTPPQCCSKRAPLSLLLQTLQRRTPSFASAGRRARKRRRIWRWCCRVSQPPTQALLFKSKRVCQVVKRRSCLCAAHLAAQLLHLHGSSIHAAVNISSVAAARLCSPTCSNAGSSACAVHRMSHCPHQRRGLPDYNDLHHHAAGASSQRVHVRPDGR